VRRDSIHISNVTEPACDSVFNVRIYFLLSWIWNQLWRNYNSSSSMLLSHIVTRLQAGRPGFDSRQGQGLFYRRHHCSHTDSGTHPASYPTDTGDISPGAKRLGYEADHLTPYSAEVNNAWTYISTPPYVFMGWCLVKYRMSSCRGT